MLRILTEKTASLLNPSVHFSRNVASNLLRWPCASHGTSQSLPVLTYTLMKKCFFPLVL